MSPILLNTAAITIDPSKPLTMVSLFPYFAGLAMATLATGLGIAKWFLNTQVTGKIDDLSAQLAEFVEEQRAVNSDHSTKMAVLTERVQNIKESKK